MHTEFAPDKAAFSRLLNQEHLDIICLADAPWNYTLWTNRQYALSTFAHIYPNTRILYVEPASFFWRIGYPQREVWPSGALVLNSNTGPSMFCREVQERIWAIHPPLPTPASVLRKIRPFFPLIQKEITWFTKRAIQALNFKKTILWTYTPYAGWFLGSFNEVFRIYEAVDDHALSSFYSWDRDRLLYYENKLTRESNVNFATSKKLLEARLQHNSNSYLIGNPVNFSLFSQAQSTIEPRPVELKRMTKPILGFYGVLADYRVDVVLLERIATTYPNYELMLIGDIADKSFEKLFQYPNVHIIPSVTQTELIKYLSYFDILLMPYQRNEYISFSSPLKLLEYFSTGKPIVSSFIPEEKHFHPLMFLGTTHDEFISQIPKALEDHNLSNRTERIRIAGQFTWEHKLYKMFQMMVKNGLLEKLM